MCIGIPMQVLEVREAQALCEGAGRQELVNTLLIDTPEVGDWLLVFLGSAREILTPEQAAETINALTALDLALRGENVDHLFQDLPSRINADRG